MPKSTEPPKSYRLIAEPGVLTLTGREATFRLHAPLPKDHPFYSLVGRVASEWSHLEHTLDLIIWELARWGTSGFTDQIAACITSQISGLPGRCSVIESLGSLRGISASLLREVRKLRNDSHKPAGDRARIVHDAWYIERNTEAVGAFRAMPPSDPRFGVQEYTEREFNSVLEMIARLQTRAGALRNTISAALQRKPT